MIIFTAFLLGAAWRWWDGRGFGPTWLRHGVAAGLCAGLLVQPLELWSLLIGALWSASWSFKQKPRESYTAMIFRHTWPAAITAVALYIVTQNPMLLAFTLTGVPIGVLVTLGTKISYAPPHPWLDSAAVTEFLSGGLSLGVLAALLSI